jgi:hypothetical protein
MFCTGAIYFPADITTLEEEDDELLLLEELELLDDDELLLDDELLDEDEIVPLPDECGNCEYRLPNANIKAVYPSLYKSPCSF